MDMHAVPQIASAQCGDPDCNWFRDARDYEPGQMSELIRIHEVRFDHRVIVQLKPVILEEIN